MSAALAGALRSSGLPGCDSITRVRPSLITFRRPSFSRKGAAVTAWVLVLVLAWAFFGPSDLEVRAIFGGFAVLSAPFIAVVWWRVAQRIELDESGITVAGRISRRHYSWQQYADDPERTRRRLPSYNWDDSDAQTVVNLDEVEPLFPLEPPTDDPDEPHHQVRLQSFVYARRLGGWILSSLHAILALRAASPTGDWMRQLATLVAAQEKFLPGASEPPGDLPSARVVDD